MNNIAKLGMLNIEVPKLSADGYLMAGFLSRGNHR
jgi:hypothetical protein